MWSWCAIVLVCTASFACRQILGVDDLPDATPCAETLFGTGNVQVCTTLPGPSLALTGTFDTDTSTCVTETLRDGTPACVVGGSTAEVSMVIAVGSRPLVIIANDTLTVSGSLDVASHLGAAPRGAGSDPEACGVATVATRTTDGGGGAGGTFATAGGNGGAGFTDGVGSVAVTTTSVTGFRGGCPGSAGANTADTSGVPGNGGGAVFLIAGTSIDIASTINASGEGGGSGAATGGGGGGGSGGLIGFDAPAITLTDTAVVIAHGGSGGEGGGNVSAGQNGADPDAAMPAIAAGGGGDTVSGGDGGDGAIGSLSGGDGLIGLGTPTSGGGGGGGGVGVVIVRGVLTGGTISPPPL